MREILRQPAANLMHPPVAPSGRVFRGKLGALLREINEQSELMRSHWNSKETHYSVAVPAMNRRNELQASASAYIAEAMRSSGRGGYNFRNAKQYWIGFISGIKLYYNCDSLKFAEVLRQHMPEESQWIAQSIAYDVSKILRG